jgi:hypothetical protein
LIPVEGSKESTRGLPVVSAIEAFIAVFPKSQVILKSSWRKYHVVNALGCFADANSFARNLFGRINCPYHPPTAFQHVGRVTRMPAKLEAISV